MLRDLEALLLEIDDPASREYMREAVRCYQGGAYRAAVVVAVAAGMDDLRRKLELLASSGAPPQAVKDAHAEVNRRYSQQEAFESTLLDHSLKVDLIAPAEDKKLRTLLQTRHLCGHPSGHRGSPEEARAAIAGMTDLVMSRPALLGMTAVSDLLTRIEHGGFFPNAEEARVRDVVKKELEVVNPSHYPALVARLIAAATGLVEARKATHALQWMLSPRATALSNTLGVLRAIIGESKVGNEAWKRLSLLVNHPDGAESALAVLAGSDGAGLRDAPALVRMRAVALVRRNLTNADARRAVGAWFTAGVLSEDEIDEFRTTVQGLASSRPPSAELTDLVFSLDWTNAIPVYLERLVSDAATGTWTTANAAIDTMQGLPDERAGRATSQQQLDYVQNVAGNSVGVYPSNSAKAIRLGGLAKRTAYLDAVARQVEVDPSKLLTRNVQPLAEIIEKSGQHELAKRIEGAARAALEGGTLDRSTRSAIADWLEPPDRDAE